MGLQKGNTCEGITFQEFSLWQAQINRRPLRRTKLSPYADEETTCPMALLDEAKQWLTEHGLEVFLRIAEAPLHNEPVQAAATIDLYEIMEGTVQALTGLHAGGLQLVQCPSNKIMFDNFGEYSLSSKAYRTQGIVGVWVCAFSTPNHTEVQSQVRHRGV